MATNFESIDLKYKALILDDIYSFVQNQKIDVPDDIQNIILKIQRNIKWSRIYTEYQFLITCMITGYYSATGVKNYLENVTEKTTPTDLKYYKVRYLAECDIIRRGLPMNDKEMKDLMKSKYELLNQLERKPADIEKEANRLKEEFIKLHSGSGIAAALNK
jgi:hypothetical protein